MDRLGRVVLPAEVRKQLEIREGDLIDIAVDDDGRIVLEKV
ncbi:MAG: AbrB/MazE/SpoVT family DNA-binding domain-containing protein, partial [Acidimicrobiia bacterium]